MSDLVKSQEVLTWRKLTAVLFTVLLCNGCTYLTDNSTELAYKIESASKTLQTQKDGSEVVVHYESKDSKAPFTVLVLSEKGISANELYKKGIDSSTVKGILPQLPSGEYGKNIMLVYQNGEMTNTTYYRRFADVKDSQIINGAGSADIVVKKTGVGKDVIFIELNKQK